ncbi:MAG: guanitoxin biosynthesis heme-dependent pre-guanitoxin N-hydroxylase GntA [Flavisolibacter sp.]
MEQNNLVGEYLAFLNNQTFPCIGAKTAITKQQLRCMVAGNMACPKDDRDILRFLYDFVEDYRKSPRPFHSAAIIFNQPQISSEELFDELLWLRLQALIGLDKENYNYDKRVSNDPASPFFSFSLKEEAFFIIGLHSSSSRLARQFKYPTLVFNPHSQFEKLRETNRYEHMKTVIRKRDMAYSGSVNPMLEDFGAFSEVYQYSGRKYDAEWRCPLKFNNKTK